MSQPASLLDRVPEPRKGGPLLSAGGAVVVHAALVLLALYIGTHFAREAAKAPAVSEMVEIEAPPEPPPAEVPEAKPEPQPVTKVSHAEPKEAPAAAAAQAGQVLTAADEVVDFGESFVVGKGTTYAGGVTEANGTATNAVRDLGARAGGVPGGTGTARPPPPVDRSRAPALAGGSHWDCPFPLEADDAGVDHAVVTLRIEVAADGRVVSASPSADPGHGFGREARRCAMSKRWAPGLDESGAAIGATTVVNVRFDR